ncbi:MAG: thiamine pyrophosphate-dependent enzyme, partial [Acidimicrobiales bacterium]
VGAPQTIIQRDLFGSMVRRFEEPGVARWEASGTWRALASRLWRAASGDAPSASPGPVHLNAAFVEPLVAAARPTPPGRAHDHPWRRATPATPARATLEVGGARVLAVVGHGVAREVVDQCWALDWVPVGDATTPATLPYVDALLRGDDFAERARPTLVVRLGGLAASKVLRERLHEWGVRTVALSGAGEVADPDGLVSEVVAGLPDAGDAALRGDARYAQWWRDASARVEQWAARRIDAGGLSEPAVARIVVAASTRHDVALVVGSSMPVRDVEWWAPARHAATYANRGVNGIDGVVSTMLGVGAGQRVLGLVGDLTALHDVSALVDGVGGAGSRAVLVVVDNRGGGIFSFLAPARELTPERFERLFATPRGHDLVAVARAFGHRSERVATADALRAAIDAGLGRAGLSVLVVDVPSREENVALHDALVGEVAALGGSR